MAQVAGRRRHDRRRSRAEAVRVATYDHALAVLTGRRGSPEVGHLLDREARSAVGHLSILLLALTGSSDHAAQHAVRTLEHVVAMTQLQDAVRDLTP